MFYTESIKLGLRFIPQSIFYTQSVMLSPHSIAESVFYTQSVVRSLCFNWLLPVAKCASLVTQLKMADKTLTLKWTKLAR